QPRSGQVGDSEGRVRRAQVGSKNEARRRVQRELGGWSAARGESVIDRADEAQFHERFDARGDGRAGKPGEGGQCGASARLSIAKQLEQFAGSGGSQG